MKMMMEDSMKLWTTSLILILSIIALTGCSGDDSSNTAAAAANPQAEQGGGQFGGEPFQSAYLDRSYDNALQPTTQLSLGTLQLEGSANAITADQAKKLLPLWQGIQNGAFQNAAERNAVYKQIEAAMTPDQMNQIVAMQLTFESMTEWAEANGITLPQGSGGPGQGNGAFANMSEEERAKFREEMQSLTPEQRQARLSEMGIERGPGQGGDGQGTQGRRGGLNSTTLEPLITLLSSRATE